MHLAEKFSKPENHDKVSEGPGYVTSLHEFVFHFTKTGAAPLDRLSIGV